MSQLQFQDYSADETATSFADIMLPVPIPKLFTYRIPRNVVEKVAIGYRVIVQFGNKKILTGVVAKIHQTPPTAYEARYLIEVLDNEPVLTGQQLKLLKWVADYYLCTIGEVLNIALPSGLKLSSESNIQLHPEFEEISQQHVFTEKEELLINSLKERKTLSYSEAAEAIAVKDIHRLLKPLLERKIVLLFEEVKEKFQPKKVRRIRLAAAYTAKEKIEELFDLLAKKAKQEDVLLKYLQEVPVFQSSKLNEAGIDKKRLLKGDLSAASLQTMIKKNIFEEFELTVSRFNTTEETIEREVKLNAAQFAAKEEILTAFKEKETVLLHGVTGSGKTEIYIQLIKEALGSGSQVLYLLPEIALTTQIVSRLKKFFGENMGVYHSKFSDNERVEVWRGVLSGKFSFVIGVRSAVFLPFDNLGLVIIDEEHETSYKQYDPAPRYHARDLALVLSQLHFAKTLLGSATPSIESYYNANTGKYGLVNLKDRFGDALLPKIKLADVRAERKRKTLKADFSSELIAAIGDKLEKREQVIIFQNRRGYAPFLTCEACAWIPKCENCAVSLTYHMYHHELRCHYCGFKEKVPNVCKACGSNTVKTIGFGTEKLEDDLKLLFPAAKIQRMDLDTTRRKYSYQTIIDNFEKGNVDILVGTQMVSKGLDFDKVSLVGIVDADRMIHFPDFRSFERAFQMITQVSGRAGRREKEGLVFIQTANTAQPVLQHVINNDYNAMYNGELQERKHFLYPPFVRLLKIVIKHEEKKVSERAADLLAGVLAEKLGKSHILGPQEPSISKIRNKFLMEIWVKMNKNAKEITYIKETIQAECQQLVAEKRFKKIKITLDVDPA